MKPTIFATQIASAMLHIQAKNREFTSPKAPTVGV